MSIDPYLARGLRRNPFVAESTPGVAPSVRINVGVEEPDATVVELVGVKGAGKTTHLLAWLEGVSGAYHHVDPGLDRWRRLPLPADAAVVAWDEVDRVPSRLLARAVGRARRRGVRVRLGTHHPTGLADVSITLPRPTAALVADFARTRIDAVAIGAAPLDLPAAAADRIAARSQGCWWTVGTLLHAWAAAQVAPVGVGR